jgi:Transposase
MTMRRRRSFTPEFKAKTVELVRTSGKPVAEVCRDVDLTETADLGRGHVGGSASSQCPGARRGSRPPRN